MIINPMKYRMTLPLLCMSFLLLAAPGRVHALSDLTLVVMAVNPSQDQSQKAELRVALPKEISPEDIVDTDGLEVIYDSREGSYYLFGEHDLAPGETYEHQISIRDIWKISEEELGSIDKEIERISQLPKELRDPELKERARYLSGVLGTKLKKIRKRQTVLESSPDRHIYNHRENLQLLESIKRDLLLARSLFNKANPQKQPRLVWQMFLGVILFLGLISVGLYFTWYRQLKSINAPTFTEIKSKDSKSSQGERRQANEKKEIGPDDIKKIISGE
jgi:hypothetical protein